MGIDYMKLLGGSGQSEPIDLSILGPQMISEFGKQDLANQKLKLDMIGQLMGKKPEPRFHNIEVNGRTFNVSEDHLAPLLNAGANYMGAASKADYYSTMTPHYIEDIQSKILDRSNRNRIAAQQTASLSNLRSAQQKELEAKTAEIPETSQVERDLAKARMENLFTSSDKIQQDISNSDRDYQLQRDLADSLIQYRADMAEKSKVPGGISPIDKIKLDLKEKEYLQKVADYTGDDEKPFEARVQSATEYNRLASGSVGFAYEYKNQGKSGGKIRPIFLPYDSRLKRKLTMEDVRFWADANNVSVEEVLTNILKEMER